MRNKALNKELNEISNIIESKPLTTSEDWLQIGRQVQIANVIKKMQDDFAAGNPISLLDAIYCSYRNGFSMPLWAHKAVSEAISKYFKNHGDASFDSFLGINKTRGRGTDPFTKTETKEFNNSVINMIVFLNKVVGFTLTFSYLLLSERGVEKGIVANEEKPLIHLSTNRIAEIYKGASKEKKRVDLFLSQEIFKNTPMHRIFNDNFEKAFTQICEPSKSDGKLKMQKKAIKQYQSFIKKSQTSWNKKDLSIFF